MSDREGRRDALWYGGFAILALGAVLVDAAPLVRTWGRFAAASYVLGAVAAALGGRTVARRTAIAVGVFVGAALVPLGLEVAWRAERHPASHAKSETVVTEASATAFVRGRNPYAIDYSDGPLARFPRGVDTHVPYLPGNLAFGLTRSAYRSGAAGDARMVFAAAFLGTTTVALSLSRAPSGVQLRAFMIVVVSPLGARYLVGGGNDLPVIGAMLLALVLVQRGRPTAAGLSAGLAAAVKLTAWPLVPFLVAASRQRLRTAGVAAAVVGVVVVPFLLWDPAAMIEDVVLYPLGLTPGGTPAVSPTVGGVLSRWFPDARGAIAVVAGIVVAAASAWILVARSPRTARDAARATAVVMVLATVLATAGRFGYLVYAIDLWVWSVWVLGPHGGDRVVRDAA